MKLAVFAYSRRGCETAGRIMKALPQAEIQAFTMEKYLVEGFRPLEKPGEAFYGRIFSQVDAMVFVSSCGIAVRQIAPHVRDKKTDPAVICVDELGKFAISLLSGHIGGANDLTLYLAEQLQAVPVVTTATDINGKFSVDAWAARNGCGISDMKAAKAISARILEKPVGLLSRFPVRTGLPSGVQEASGGDLGILLSWQEESPFTQTLRLIPPVLHLGIGCRKGIAQEAITHAVEQVLQDYRIDRRAIRCAASIDLKAQEQGLLDFCKAAGIPITFYSAQELNAVPGEFTKSQFVSSITGVDNVCERAAMLGADRLIVKKTACNGVTVAVAEENWEVYFG